MEHVITRLAASARPRPTGSTRCWTGLLRCSDTTNACLPPGSSEASPPARGPVQRHRTKLEKCFRSVACGVASNAIFGSASPTQAFALNAMTGSSWAAAFA